MHKLQRQQTASVSKGTLMNTHILAYMYGARKAALASRCPQGVGERVHRGRISRDAGVVSLDENVSNRAKATVV